MILGGDSTFNNVSLSDYNLYVCDFDDSVLKEVGFKFRRNVTIDNKIKFNPSFSVSDTDDYVIDLNFILYDKKKNKKLIWTDDILLKVYSWLITDDFKEFKTEGREYSYYLMATDIQKVFTIDRKGYLRVTFKSIDKYAYKKETYKATVNGERSLEIKNLSNEIYKPKIIITNNGNHKTTNKINQLEIIGMQTGETLTIDNLLHTAECNGENAFDRILNRKWVSLETGKNMISLEGYMTVEIVCNFPVIL